jgi:hypothetical protein
MDELQALFAEHYDVLLPTYIANNKPSELIDRDNKEEMIKVHQAMVNEMKTSFSAALQKDRLYQRPAGFVQDTQIWLIGVLSRYMVK